MVACWVAEWTVADSIPMAVDTVEVARVDRRVAAAA